MDKPDLLLENLWLPLVATVLGGLVLAGLGAAVSKTVRQRFWRPIGRGLALLPTVRLTTTKRVAAVRNAADAAIEAQRRQYEKLLGDADRNHETTQVRLAAARDQASVARALGFKDGRAVAEGELRAAEARADAEKAEAARVRGVAAEAINQMQAELDEAKELARKAGLEQVENHGRLMEYARAQGAAEGRAEAEAEVAAQRAALVVRPVWRVIDTKDPWLEDEFALKNLQPGVGEMRDVWIEARGGRFLFNSPSQWPGEWKGAVMFRGERAAGGRSTEVEFDVHYRDWNGDWKQGLATLARPALEPGTGGAASWESDGPLGPLPKHF